MKLIQLKCIIVVIATVSLSKISFVYFTTFLLTFSYICQLYFSFIMSYLLPHVGKITQHVHLGLGGAMV